jgi:hypothetical protein
MAKETKVADAAKPASAMTTYDWSQSKVTGLEATRQEDLGIPFLSILQDMSPQVKKSDPNYATKGIKDAQPGDIINTLSNTIVYRQGGEAIKVIPCFHERMYVEWKANRGGFVAAHKSAAILRECTRNPAGEDVLRNGNVIMETAYFYVIALINGEKVPAIIGMTSMGLKKARNWLNLITGIRLQGPNGPFMPPMFSHIYQVGTVIEVKEKNSWYGWDIKVEGQLQDGNLITKAVQMAEETASNQRRALPPAVDSPKGEPDNVPFA